MAHLPKGQGIFLPPFKAWLASNIPAVYDNTMSYYEELVALIKYLQDIVVPAVNDNAAAVTAISEAQETLQAYVDNYFDNLDVQEEINNKLDQMAEDGTLQEIITAYIQSNVAWTFDTVADMKTATNLVAGSYAKTLGFYAIDDNGGGLYYIDDSGTANEMDTIAIGSLYAKLVKVGKVYAEQFGAKAQSGFDNKTIIEYAIANTTVLNFGNGEFYVSNKVALTSDTTLNGDETKIYSDSPFVLAGSEIENIYIKNIEFESTVDTTDTINMSESEPDSRGYTTLSSIIDIYNSSNIKIENCKVHGGFTGIYVHTSNNVIVKDNNCYGSSSKVICLSQSKYKLINNYIHDIEINGDDYYPCYLFQSTDNIDVNAQESSLIDGNRFENNENWDAIMCHRYDKITITNNHISNVRTGIDLTVPSSTNTDNGNIIISNNYIEGTTTNRWAEQGLNHGIIIIGDSYTKNIAITGNIIRGFGRFLSPSGGSCLHIQSTDSITIESNVIDFETTTNTIFGAIMLRNTNNNVNISNNIINANDLLTILFNQAVCDLLVVKDNVLNTTRNVAIDVTGTVNLTHSKIDNSYKSTYQMNVRNNTTLNTRTFTTTDARPLFSIVEKFIASIDTFDIGAGATVRKFISKASIGKTDIFDNSSIFTVKPSFGTLPQTCFIQAVYGDSSNISVCFYNASSSTITIPSGNYIIKIER